MSGGRFNYSDSVAQSEIFGYCDDNGRIPNVFKDREISELIWDVFNLIHDFDWYESGDTSEGSYNKAKAEFKAKWFTEAGRTERFERYIEEYAKEMRTMLGIDDWYCHNCERFTPSEKYSDYGDCEIEKGCMTHSWEKACVKFKKKE